MANLISNSLAVMISDLHVGDPRNLRLDDFSKDDDFERLLTKVIPQSVGQPATLIIAGDFIDFPQVLPELGKHDFGDRLGVTEDQSVSKFKRVHAGHPKVFEAIKDFLDKEGNQILVLPGNHDIDLHWGDVLRMFREAVGGAQSPQLHFIKNGYINEQRIYIEHGNQYSFDNWFEFWETPILKDSWNRKRLERPWGTLFMDMVYNDIEDLYPFVNKIYPHVRFATIAIRSFFKNEERVSIKPIAELVFFLMWKGKHYLMGQLLGKEEALPPPSIEDFLLELGVDEQDPGFDEVVSETSKLISAARASETAGEGGSEEVKVFPDSITARSEPVAEDLEVEGLLGRTDERGMAQRKLELWIPGKVDLIAFGHTHVAIDGNKHPESGLNSPRRVFNTGSWMPSMPIGEYEAPKWKDLKSMPRTHEVRYLVIELTNPPNGRLESL